MRQPIESYLNHIKIQLKGLPAEELDLQIEEIEQHLQRMIEEEIAHGLSEADAVQAAMTQFGEPKEIGRDIREAFGGTKTGIFRGIVLGAAAGAASVLMIVLPIWLVIILQSGSLHQDPNIAIGILSTVPAAVAGAMASLVGRRFTKKYLTRPAKPVPILGAYSQPVIVFLRVTGVAALRGAIGGAMMSVLAIILQDIVMVILEFGKLPLEVKWSEFLLLLLVQFLSTAVYAIIAAILAAFVGSIAGVVLATQSRTQLLRHQT